MMISMLLFWLAVIAFCIAAMRYFFDQSYPQVGQVGKEKPKNSQLKRLQERYERGEISSDEYHHIMNTVYNQQEDTHV